MSGVRSVAIAGRALPDPRNAEPRAGLSIPANDVISIIESAFFLQTLLTGGSTLSLGCSRNAQFFEAYRQANPARACARSSMTVQPLKEIARLASLLYDSTTQSTADPKSAIGPEADRVLCRLGIYRELGLSVDGVATADRRRMFEELIPPSLRQGLLRNLTAHGKQVCRATMRRAIPVKSGTSARHIAVSRSVGLIRVMSLRLSTSSPAQADFLRAWDERAFGFFSRSIVTRWLCGLTH